MNIVLLFLLMLFLSLFAISFLRIRSQSNEELVFIYRWASPLGSFVWEDLLIFSLLHIIFISTGLLLQDFRIIALFTLVFWAVRSTGEALYWFLQQFHQPTVYPHDQYKDFKLIRFILGDISNQRCFIIMQIFWQCITVASLTVLILLLLNWNYMSRLN
jgi:hypothetical protein